MRIRDRGPDLVVFAALAAVCGIAVAAISLLNARRRSLKSKLPLHPDSVAYLNGVWNHESYGIPGVAKGHQLQIELAAKSFPTCGRVPEILERVVGRDSVSAQIQVMDVIIEGGKSLYAAADHNFVYGNHGKVPFYEVVAQPTLADTLGYWEADPDGAQAASPGLAPDSRWDCTRVY